MNDILHRKHDHLTDILWAGGVTNRELRTRQKGATGGNAKRLLPASQAQVVRSPGVPLPAGYTSNWIGRPWASSVYWNRRPARSCTSRSAPVWGW